MVEDERRQRTALVVDDEPGMRAVLARHLERLGFSVVEAGTANAAHAELDGGGFELLVCDLRLPDGSGLDVIRAAKECAPALATIIVSGGGGPEEPGQALAEDVDEFLVKPFAGQQLAIAVEAAFRRRQERGAARAAVASTREVIESGDESAAGLLGVEGILERLARAGRFRDEETAEHVERMSRASALIARALGWGEAECLELRAASALHDLGKVGVPDAILRKPGQLAAHERAVIETHPTIGHEILTGSGDPVMDLAATVALTHHERFDGQGYPRGLGGEEIPLAGRIAAVADVFDALTHDRVYRPAFSVDEAVERLRQGRGTQFDPAVVDAFEEVLPEIDAIRRRYPDSDPDEPQVGVRGEPERTEPPRVLIVEDHDAVARGLELLLRREGFEVAGNARTVGEAERMLDRRGADVAILDVELAGESGLDLIATAVERDVRVLVYTGLADGATAAKARTQGAHGVAAKAGSPRELATAVREVAAGNTYFEERFADAEEEPDERPTLTPREAEIAGLLAKGLTGEQIAKELFLSPETVRTHIRNAMARAGAHTRAHLAGMVARGGGE